jgi:hypothetical protein
MDQAQIDQVAALKYTVIEELEGAYGHRLDGWLSEGAKAACSCLKCGAEVKIDCGNATVLREESRVAYEPCDAHKRYATVQASD